MWRSVTWRPVSRNPRGRRFVGDEDLLEGELLAVVDVANRLHEPADVAALEGAMRAARVHRHLAVAAGERELRSRLRVEAVEEALVDVDAVLVRRPEDDDREAVPPVVHGQPALAERQLELPIGARHRLEQELEVAR